MVFKVIQKIFTTLYNYYIFICSFEINNFENAYWNPSQNSLMFSGADHSLATVKMCKSCRVGNFRQKNYSPEDWIDGTIGLFQQKIPAVPRNRKFSEFRPDHSAKEKCLEFCTMEKN